MNESERNTVPGFTLDEWKRATLRADALMKQNNGHSFMTILKTRCQYCGRSRNARGKCPAWASVLVSNILFVLMNKDIELSPAADAVGLSAEDSTGSPRA
jgi:hypothetical protein